MLDWRYGKVQIAVFRRGGGVRERKSIIVVEQESVRPILLEMSPVFNELPRKQTTGKIEDVSQYPD